MKTTYFILNKEDKLVKTTTNAMIADLAKECGYRVIDMAA